MRPDPNKDRNDPMVAEYWSIGEDLQDAIRKAGYESDTVEGIAVDVHDLLQSADAIRAALENGLQGATDPHAFAELLNQLTFEFDHIRWHCEAAQNTLSRARQALDQ